MEAGFLNFHDEEHFSDFSLSLDHQHNLLSESQSALAQIVDTDFDYVESFGIDSNDALWETEQELNGDLAVLPVSGVSGAIPRMDQSREDYAKVLTDWHEHIGFLQSSELEEDMDMVNLDMGLDMSPVDDAFESPIRETVAQVFTTPVKSEPETYPVDNLLVSPMKFDAMSSRDNRFSESDQSEKEIDVVGLDSFDEVDPVNEFMHVSRQHAKTSSKEYKSKTLDDKIVKSKPGTSDNIIIKEEPLDLEDDIYPESLSPTLKTEYTKSSKRKKSKKHKDERLSKKHRKSSKAVIEVEEKVSKKSKKDVKLDMYIEETSSSSSISSSLKKTPVLEAGDVKSLLEQFEATEAAAISSGMPEISQVPKIPKKSSAKFPVNNSQVTLLKKSDDSQDSRLHKDIRDSLPKEVIDRIKASGRKKPISIIPAMPNKKTGTRNNGTRMQEAGATLSRNKLLKLVTSSNTNSNGRFDGSVQLDHDYCSNPSSALSSSSNSCDSNFDNERRNSDMDITPVKDKHGRQQCSSQATEYVGINNQKVSTAVTKNWSDSSSKKDSGLESGDVSDASEEQTPASKVKKSLLQDNVKVSVESKTTAPVQKSLLNDKAAVPNKANSSQPKPVYEMKIQSALATSILQLRNGVITTTKSLDSHKPKQQMVSVLKKPPMSTTPQKIPGSNLMESIVTTTNSMNNEVQNILVQEATDIEMPEEMEKKPPRRKLNLAEYRSRREQNRSDGSRTNSPVQPMTLIYIHHVSTNTEPISEDPDNPMWSEREIVSVLKPKAEVEEEKLKPKPSTCEIGVQTIETVFGVAYEEGDERVQKSEMQLEPEKAQKQIPQSVDSIIDTAINSNDIGAMVNKNNDSIVNYDVMKHPVNSDKIDTIVDKDMINRTHESNTIDLIVNTTVEDMDIDEEIESGEITNEEILREEAASNEIIENVVQAPTGTPLAEKEKADTSINRMRDRKSRNYRRSRASPSSSRSRSRSRSRSHSRKNTRRHRSRSRGSSRSRSRSSSYSSRSRSRSRSRTRRHTRSRRISHRRSSVSSNSSWSSRSRSRSRSRSSHRYRSSSRSTRTSRSRSPRSRSRSPSRSRSRSYSSYSRSSSRSNYGRSRRSSHRRNGRKNRRRSYDRLRRHSSTSSRGYNNWRRSPIPSYRRPYDNWQSSEKQRQVEERRVVYVGRLDEGITKAELRKRFENFGPVVDISVHFRERGHNYGFVTFSYKEDAYQAVEHGNDDPTLPRYDLCFGGRRQFCKVKYADLDGANDESYEGRPPPSVLKIKPEEENTFDLLLKEAQAKLKKRKV